MVEVIAATAGALLTACFVSVGSISFRNREQRDDLVRIQTSVESLNNQTRRRRRNDYEFPSNTSGENQLKQMTT